MLALDVLDDILTTLNLKGALYFRTDFSPPWAVAVPGYAQAARFHLVVQGRCHVSFPSGRSVVLNAGDVILIPRGMEHALSDDASRDAPPLERVIEDIGYRGKGVLTVGAGKPEAATRMICGHLSFRDGADHPLLRALPQFILLAAADRARSVWLDEVLRLLVRRMFSDGEGVSASVTRLSEVFFIEMLRLDLDRNPQLASVLAAMKDRQIGKALLLFHQNADRPWTVEAVATEVGMSRSSFAERFRELLGTAPMAYLSEWRLQKALCLLEDSRCTIGQVATRTGYRSAAAFSRAFAAKFGQAPREIRQAMR